MLVDSFDTGEVSDEKLARLVEDNFELKPVGIIAALDLKRPIFEKTAAYGHFGRSTDGGFFPWERTDRAAELRKAAGLPAK